MTDIAESTMNSFVGYVLEYKIKETTNDCSIRLFLMQLDFALMLTTLLLQIEVGGLHTFAFLP